MPAEAGQKADWPRSYGMQLSWDINDPQMPQVREIPQRARRCPSEEENGLQVLAETVDSPPAAAKHTSLRAPQCAGAPRWRSWV